MEAFSGSRAILSGPAGGVVGYAVTTYCRTEGQPIIGFDMGGRRQEELAEPPPPPRAGSGAMPRHRLCSAWDPHSLPGLLP